MFYYLNDSNKKNNKRKNKRKNNPYKVLFKHLIDDLSNTDINKIQIVNDLFDHKVEGIVPISTWLKDHGNNSSTKEIEKQFRNLFNETGFEKLFHTYISILNVSLSEHFILNSSRNNNLSERDVLENYDEFQVRRRARTIIAKIALYSIMVSEDLFNKKIHRLDIKDNHSESKIIKEVKSEPFSLMIGIDDIPVLLSQKEAKLLNLLVTKFKLEGYPLNMFEHIKLVYTHRQLEYLISMYCFGSDFNKLFRYEEFIDGEGERIKDTKFYPVPCDVLSRRRFIPPDDGVVIQLINHPSIESIYLNECTRFNFRMVYGVVRLSDGFEQPYSLKIDNNLFSICFAVNSHDLVSIITNFYQIPAEDLDIMKGLKKAPKYNILSSEHWNYRTSGYVIPNTNKTDDNLTKNKAPKFTTYIRKTKGNASKETLSFANRLQITLSDNETLVKERDRNYNRF